MADAIDDGSSAARYAQSGKTITLIGIHFDPEQRNLAEWRVEQP